MHLADITLLKWEEIQLLADSLQAVFTVELTPVAEILIRRELLHAFPAICQQSKPRLLCSENHEQGRGLFGSVESRTGQHVRLRSFYRAGTAQRACVTDGHADILSMAASQTSR